MPDYRPITETEYEEYSRLIHYAFTPMERYEPVESRAEAPGWSTIAEERGLFADEELVSTVAHYWHTLRVRGEFHDVAGVASVSTPPKHRRNGYIRQLLAASLEEYHDRGVDFAVLWPFSYSFYRQFGWGLCSERRSITCSPDALGFVDRIDPPPNSEFVELTPDRWEELDAVYTDCNDHELAMRRTEQWWKERVFNWRTDPYITGVERGGTLRGYVVYTITNDETRTMSVSELGYVDTEAYTELLRFCRYHDSQVSQITMKTDDSRLYNLVEDPRAVDIEVHPGAMFRIVDLKSALTSLSYPVDGSVVLEVTDELAEWNDRRLRLTVNGGEPTCGTTIDSPDVIVDVATLSQIVTGYLSVESAAETGDLTVELDTKTLSELFPESDPHLREWF